MADSRRDQEYLGIDSNILVAYVVPDHPAHDSVKWLIERNHAINATVLHESYHTLVFKLKRRPDQTRKTLLEYMGYVLFLSTTAQTAELGLRLAVKHALGGRDALILASYLLSKEVRTLVTMEKGLLTLRKITLGEKVLEISSAGHASQAI